MLLDVFDRDGAEVKDVVEGVVERDVEALLLFDVVVVVIVAELNGGERREFPWVLIDSGQSVCQYIPFAIEVLHVEFEH